MKEYVLDHRPDLVIIGGISHRNDISSIREVIRQIRGTTQADILLMTGAFGQTDPRNERSWQTISDPNQYTDIARAWRIWPRKWVRRSSTLRLPGASTSGNAEKTSTGSSATPCTPTSEASRSSAASSRATSPTLRDRKQLPQDQETDPLVLDKLDRFQDWKFGFMMHWGIYSQWGCIESWPLVEADKWARPDDLKAWTERDKDFKWFFRDYVALNTTFNPQRFDPGKWVTAAKEAGMKYVVFTTKHHDGFCMFDTKQTDYRTTDPSCPFHTNPKADVVKAVFDTFARKGWHRRVLLQVRLAPSGLLVARLAAPRPQRQLRYE